MQYLSQLTSIEYVVLQKMAGRLIAEKLTRSWRLGTFTQSRGMCQVVKSESGGAIARPEAIKTLFSRHDTMNKWLVAIGFIGGMILWGIPLVSWELKYQRFMK